MQAALVRSTRRKHHPFANEHWRPAERGGNHQRETATPVGDREEIVHVGQFCLDLDQQQRARRRMPGNYIDHASLAEMAEGDLDAHLPTGRLEKPGDDLGHGRMPAGYDSVDFRPPPSRCEGQPHLEHARGGANRLELDPVELATLDLGIQGVGDPDPSREILLAPAEADPQLAEQATDRQIIHVAMVTTPDYVRLIARA